MTLQQDLLNFYGTEHWYRVHPLSPIVITDGVKYFAEKGDAFWAVTDIILMAHKLKQPFLSVKINSNGNKADIVYEDGDCSVLKKQHYAHTDLEKGEYTFFVTDNVLMLVGEY